VARAHNALFLLASTSEIYGDPEVHPQHEDYFGHVNPVGPRSVYDEAKRFAEAITMAYHRKHGLHTRIARIFNTFGPRMRLDDGRVVPNFIGQAIQQKPLTIFGDGKQTRSFCYVSDTVEALYRLLQTNYNRPVNIGNPVEITVLELAEMINRMTDNQAGIKMMPDSRAPADPQRRRPDITRARKLLDWNPQVDISEGLKLTIQDFQSRL
jgi:dTDP-glucose 4,6-dehydratase